MSSECKHLVQTDGPGHIPGTVCLYNDDDSFYQQTFQSREELTAFINQLIAARSKIWPVTRDPTTHPDGGRCG